MASHDLGERALTGAIRAHKCVYFALRNSEIEVFKDGLAIDGDIEIFDFERVHDILIIN